MGGLDGWSSLSALIAPMAGLVSMSFLLVVYLSPVLAYIPQLALVAIFPGRLLALATDPPFNTVDGHAIRMGMLGSCAQWSNHVLRQNCTGSSLTPSYDLTSLPGDVPGFPNPSVGTSIVFSIGFAMWTISTVIYILTKIHLWMSFPDRIKKLLGSPALSLMNLILGFFFGWLFVFASSIAAYNTFKPAVQIFNTMAAVKGPPYHAELCSGFQYLWAFCGLGLIPLFVDFAEHVFVSKLAAEDEEKKANEKKEEENQQAGIALGQAKLWKMWTKKGTAPAPAKAPSVADNSDATIAAMVARLKKQ